MSKAAITDVSCACLRSSDLELACNIFASSATQSLVEKRFPL